MNRMILNVCLFSVLINLFRFMLFFDVVVVMFLSVLIRFSFLVVLVNEVFLKIELILIVFG